LLACAEEEEVEVTRGPSPAHRAAAMFARPPPAAARRVSAVPRTSRAAVPRQQRHAAVTARLVAALTGREEHWRRTVEARDGDVAAAAARDVAAAATLRAGAARARERAALS
jgi:hypothetical protein